MQTTAVDTLHEISSNVIFLMGGSFILGSLFTILMLMLLDFMQRGKEKRKGPDGKSRR